MHRHGNSIHHAKTQWTARARVTSVDGVRHPDHDAVSQELHRW
jgi:hypothetical protein